MKVIILAGGLGTRISEETMNKPKPMVEIGGKPLLWHLMTIFVSQGYDEFIIATGYKGEVIHNWVKTVITSYSPSMSRYFSPTYSCLMSNYVVGPDRLELSTHGLKVRCSTD